MEDSFKEILSRHSDHDDNDQLLSAILSRVEDLLETQPDLLFSYMYRLDVSEADLKMTITGNQKGDLASHFAQLILDRQLQRIETRRKYGHAKDQ